MSSKIDKLDEQIRKIKAKKKAEIEKESKRVIDDILVKTFGEGYEKRLGFLLEPGTVIEVYVNGEPFRH